MELKNKAKNTCPSCGNPKLKKVYIKDDSNIETIGKLCEICMWHG